MTSLASETPTRPPAPPVLDRAQSVVGGQEFAVSLRAAIRQRLGRARPVRNAADLAALAAHVLGTEFGVPTDGLQLAVTWDPIRKANVITVSAEAA